MGTKRVYLDTSVLIAEFNRKDKWHKHVTKFFNEVRILENIELCSSQWALTELYNRLTKDQIEALKIERFINELLAKGTIRNIKLKIIDVSPRDAYDFNYFFHDLKRDLIIYKTGKDRPGLGDIFHIRIMKNNKVNTVISFDAHFEKIKGLTLLNPSTTKINSEPTIEL